MESVDWWAPRAFDRLRFYDPPHPLFPPHVCSSYANLTTRDAGPAPHVAYALEELITDAPHQHSHAVVLPTTRDVTPPEQEVRDA